jgi:hypothetical protein
VLRRAGEGHTAQKEDRREGGREPHPSCTSTTASVISPR